MADQPAKPYGDVAYADPGYQNDGKKRYPIDTEAHCRAAWSYINQGDNAAQYTAEQLASIKARIKAAGKKFGITFESSSEPSNRYLAPSAVYERYNATVADVNTSQRIIDVIAVPWNEDTAEPVPFEDGMYRERFIPGAFDHLAGNIGRIAVRAPTHTPTALVGKVTDLDPRHSKGLRASLTIAKIPGGDDVLQLAKEDMLSPSVGYYTRQGGYRKSRRLGTVEVRWAGLDHIALVGVPAYTGAAIDGMRNAAPPAAVMAADAPLLTAFLNDPVVQWAQSRVTRGRE